MKKNIFNNSNKKEWHYNAVVTVSEMDRKIGNIVIVISFIVILSSMILDILGLVKSYVVFVTFIPPVLFMIYLVIKYFILRINPTNSDSNNSEDISSNDSKM